MAFTVLGLLLGPRSGAQETAAARRDGDAVDLVLLTLDTTRADHLGAYGGRTANTPVLDKLAAHGTRYARALTPSPLTLPAHTSLLTGLDPPRHGVRDNGLAALGEDVPTLATVLAGSGYATAAFVASRVLDRRFGLARGFAAYDDLMAAERVGEYGYPERDAEAVTEAALSWLRRRPAGRPFFLWVHYYDPHAPYQPPAGPPGYAGEISYMDSQIGRLIAEVPAGSLVAVVGDHGEALGEHGERAHGLFLYRSVLEVPLILHGPGVAAAKVISEIVPTRLLPATLLGLLGQDRGALPPAVLPGLPVLRGSAEDDSATIYSETRMPATAYGWSWTPATPRPPASTWSGRPSSRRVGPWPG